MTEANAMATSATAATTPPLQTSGSIEGLYNGGFTLQTGYPHGYVKISIASSTTFVGTKPYVGESVSVTGTGSFETAINATTVTQAGAQTSATTLLQTSGTITSFYSAGFVIQSGSPHGYVRIATSSSTVYSGAKPFVGEHVAIAGTGSFLSAIQATTVTQAGSATPTPGPTPKATATPVVTAPTATPPPAYAPPNGTSTTPLMPQAKKGIGLFQVFDAFGSPRISSSQATSDASRYGVVWGARPGMASSWLGGNASMAASYYFPQETDLSFVSWGGAGHTLAWWQANHPDWILYSCTANGTPTTIPAYVGELPNNIPLDIHNPAVVDYQIHAAANYAIANGYNSLAVDEVLFYNIGGVTAGTGAYGCGIYQNGQFVRRYSGKRDAQWNADTVAWVKAAHSILKTDATLAPHNLKLIVNHPAGYISDPNEQAILANVDADVDETGYSDYGQYKSSSSLFKLTLDWVRYAQAHGTAPLVVNKYYQSNAVTGTQVEFSIATYLMGNEGGEGLFTSNNPGYGVEQYFPEYSVNYGTACGGYYGGASTDPNNPQIWYRRYSNAVVVVNSGSSRASEVATLPSGHTYRDLEGRPVSNPLTVANFDAYVLLTTNGCQ